MLYQIWFAYSYISNLYPRSIRFARAINVSVWDIDVVRIYIKPQLNFFNVDISTEASVVKINRQSLIESESQVLADHVVKYNILLSSPFALRNVNIIFQSCSNWTRSKISSAHYCFVQWQIWLNILIFL